MRFTLTSPKLANFPLKIAVSISLLFTGISPVVAQNLNSSNYTLVAPEIGGAVSGTIDSANFSQLLSIGLIDGMTSSSTGYEISGGFNRLIQANVPKVSCFETGSTGGGTVCTGIPGGDGMQG